MIASFALQVAIYNALNGNIGAGVYDEVPQGASAPYVVIGEGTERPWDTLTDHGSEETVVLHVWSRAKGWSQAKQIEGQINVILHDARLTLAGATMVIMQREFLERLTEPGDAGGMWRHSVMRYRATISA
jgi:hypothetical protein